MRFTSWNPFRRRRADDEHAEVRALASDYIDGELDEKAAEKVTVHLDKCHLCKAFFNTLRATISLLGSARGLGGPHPRFGSASSNASAESTHRLTHRRRTVASL